MTCGRIVSCVQGDSVWFEERLGRVTASRVRDVLAKTKNGESAKRQNYRMEMLTEIITGKPAEHFVTPAMDWGIQQESVARATYELNKEVEVDLVGLVIHPTIDRFAASPDGFVGSEGLVEFKCPTTTTHLGYLLSGEVPEEYKPQMMAQMACTGRLWTDFCSFDPRLPEEFSLFIVRLERDENAIGEMERGVEQFIAEVNALAGELLKRKDLTAWKRATGNQEVSGPPRAVIAEMA